MIIKANKQIGFIYKNDESIDKILKDGEVVFERGFLREKTSTTLPITFGGVGKDLKDYKIYGNTYQNSTTGLNVFNVTDYSNITLNTNAGALITEKTSDSISFFSDSTKNFSGLFIPINSFKNYVDNYNNDTIYCISADITVDKACIFGSLQTSTNYIELPIGKNRISVYSKILLNSINFYVKNAVAGGVNVKIEKIMVSVMNNDTFELYTGGQPSPNPDYPQEMVSCGDKTKNLIGFEDLPKTTSNGVTYSIKDNVFTLNGTATDNIRYIYNNKYYLGNEGDYTLKIDAISGSWTAGIIGLSSRTSNNDQARYQQIAYNSNNLTGVKEYSNNQIQITTAIGFFINSGSVFNNFKFRIIFNEGSTATSYEPYGYKIPVNVNNVVTNIYLDEPLRKIEEYSDYIDFINGRVVRKIEEYTLIGDEQIKMIREGMNCVKIDGKNIRTETNTMPPIFCNMLLANSRNSIYQGNVGIGYGAINNEYYNDIVMRVPNITTLTDFTTWLQSNNVIVDYVLATPTRESITLPNIPTVEGNNTLNIETEITPSQVYIKYKSNE